LARPREIALVACLSACLFACDIVQGFQQAGDALFPEVKTYLDVPGYRVVEGRYGYIDMVRSSEPFIVARSATAGDDTLYAMRFHAPKPCKIPSVGRYWTDGGLHAERTYIAYFSPDDPETLRFSDMACTPYDGKLLTTHLPVSYTQTGLVVQIEDELYEVNPSAATSRFLAGGVQRIDPGRALVQADGRLGAFDGNWRLVRWVGEGVVGYAPAFGTFYFEDEAGISRLSISTDDDGVRTATTSSVAEDACGLTVLPETPDVQLLAFYTPCTDGELVLWDARSRRTLPFDREIDPRYLKIQAAPANGARPDLGVDPYFALYLTEVDATTGTGTLRIRGSDGTELVIGESAALERSELTLDEGGDAFTGGFALVDVAGETGVFVRFDLAGTVTPVASGVLRSPAENDWRRLVIDVDGTLADLAEVVDGAPHVVARNVPRYRYAYVQRASYAPLYGSMAWFHDVEGGTGSLSLARKSDDPHAPLDDQGHEPVYDGTLVARGVHLDAHGFLDDLPGFVYFTHWDHGSGTGRLEYSNVELGFSAIVSEGVADYVRPGSGLLYSVPSGEGAGIWLARGK
jgi:hypothetical protein